MMLDSIDRESWPGLSFPEGFVMADHLRCILTPANGRSVIAAGACRAGGLMESYSQSGGLYGSEWKPLALVPVHVPAAIPLDMPNLQKTLQHDQWYEEYSGTSCASPVMAGAGVLFLQKYPRATTSDFLATVKRTARASSETGTLPNAKAGYGILHFFDLLTK
jgi:hypothetical protein